MGVTYFFDSDEGNPIRYLSPSRFTSELPPPYETSTRPYDYLEYAIADLKDGTDRGLVNAFGNAKRALHFTIDSLLHQFGLFIHYRRSNFPTKLHALDSIGVLPMTLMKNLNVERNLLEHEYAIPSKARVQEAVDVATLIILAMERYSERVMQEAVVGWSNPTRHLVLRIDPFAGTVSLHSLSAPGMYRRSHGISHFSGRIRRSHEDKLAEGVRVAERPWKVIKLDKQSQADWKPLLSILVGIQRKGRMFGTAVRDGGMEVTMGVTIPYDRTTTEAWNTLLDESSAKARERGSNSRRKRRAATANSEERKAA